MFKTVEVGDKIEKERYEKLAPKARASLLSAQRRLAGADKSVIVLISGVEGAGKARLADLLVSWMDARGIQVHAFDDPTDEERQRPRYWRYWRVLPPKGKMAVLLNSWYTDPIVDRAFKRMDSGAFDQELDRIADFERMLAREGVVLVKLWLHLSKKAQRDRLEKLQKDPLTRWRVTKQDWKFHKKYDRFRAVSERALFKTNTAEAPWNLIEATDSLHRNLTATRAIITGLEEPSRAPEPGVGNGLLPKPKKNNAISRLDFSLALEDGRYKRKLEKYQGQLNRLALKLRRARRSLLLVFEGPDAAGKGGAIRRLTGALDARNYRVISTSAPSDEEKARPYLWRFWRDLPRLGRTTIHDRSWYGRVLVERLEGFSGPDAWRRAYSEINAFEEQLTQFGTIILKFWIAISPEEQLRRFKSRQITPYKQYKLTQEDWRNRGKWDAYVAAACEMFERTDMTRAPWILVEADDKNWARIKIIESVCARLKKELDRE